MTTARERFLVVLALVALGGAVVLASTQVFVTAAVLGDPDPVAVQGSAALPALAPLGIVALAAGAALTIAGRVARTVLAVLLVLLGAGVAALAAGAVADPVAAVRSAARAATGVSEVDALIQRVDPSAWPVVALVVGILIALAGVVVAARVRRWPVGGRRYRAEAPPSDAPADPIDEWDAQTRATRSDGGADTP